MILVIVLILAFLGFAARAGAAGLRSLLLSGLAERVSVGAGAEIWRTRLETTVSSSGCASRWVCFRAVLRDLLAVAASRPSVFNKAARLAGAGGKGMNET